MHMRLPAIIAGLAIGAPALADISQFESEAIEIGEYVAKAIGMDGQSSQPSTACSKIADAQATALKRMGEAVDPSLVSLDAQLAFECVKSVQLVEKDALQLIEYAKHYWQFQTTLLYMKTPTDGYQQPPVDIMGRLDTIAARVSAGAFTSQYDFDYEIFKLVADSHEGHFGLSAGILANLFSWQLQLNLTSASENGVELPKVFVWQDIIAAGSNSTWKPSPVETIEGLSTVDYIAGLSKNSVQGAVTEAHAEWNIIMQNSALTFGNDIPPSFAKTVVYRGSSVKGNFENGTDFEWPFFATSQFSLKDDNLSTPEEIYDNVIVAPAQSTTAPATSTETGIAATAATVQPTGLPAIPFPNYPQNPIVRQEPFGPVAGVVSGYLIKEASVGVISIPSFETGQDQYPLPSTFSKAVADCIRKSKQAGMKKIVIDVSGNGGGTAFQAYDSFRHFFPNIDPFQLFRTRATPVGNTLGKALTTLTLNEDKLVNATTQQSFIEGSASLVGFSDALTLDEQSKPFSSWEDFYGPIAAHGDKFTNPGRYNFSNPNVDLAVLDEFVFGFGNNYTRGVNASTPPYGASDIVILSDGFCGSTCAIFSELMKTQGGVKFVAVGGTPTFGPMQPVAGTRGSSILKWNNIDLIVRSIQSLLTNPSEAQRILDKAGITKSELQALPPPLAELRYSAASTSGSFNALDIVRPGEDTPLQFTYEPADCRLFYTHDMIRDQSLVWKAAAKIIDGDYGACVRGSTNQKGRTGTNTTFTGSPGFNSSFEAVNTTWKGNATWGSRNSAGVASLSTAALPGATGAAAGTNAGGSQPAFTAKVSGGAGGQGEATKTGPKPTASATDIAVSSEGVMIRASRFAFAIAAVGMFIAL